MLSQACFGRLSFGVHVYHMQTPDGNTGMIEQGKKRVTLFVRIICSVLVVVFLNACQSKPCEKYWTIAPTFPSETLKKVEKPLPIFQRRNYDLCLLKKANVQIIRVGQTWKLILPSDEVFENDTPDIQSRYQSTLAIVADFMKTYSKVVVTVSAYSDKPIQPIKTKFGAIEDELTAAQAAAVAADLTAKQINARLIVAKGMGAKEAVAWDGTPKGRYLNRRVEIYFRYYRDSKAWF